MPKKGKGKQTQHSPHTESLPQVWLPNEIDLGHGAGVDHLPMEHTHDQPPPTEDEQQQMAMYWAMEEANTPRGWDDEAELDYLAVSQRQAQAEQTGGSPVSKASGNRDLFNYAQTSVFTVKHLGHLKNVPPQHRRRSSGESQTDTLEAIDAAQRQGRMPWVTSDSDQRIISLSKYGVKVMDDKKQQVFSRHPLHCIANITYYEDTYSKHMLALRLAKPHEQQGTDNNELVIYECTDETQAKDICLTLAQAFEAVHNKMKFEQNLPRTEL